MNKSLRSLYILIFAFAITMLVALAAATPAQVRVLMSGGFSAAYQQLLPEFQSKGIGTQLITKLQEERANAVKPIMLCVLHSNPAFALYARLGFEVIASDSQLHTMRWAPTGPR